MRSSRSSVRKWPDAATVDAAVRRWAELNGTVRDELLAVGYTGSYARGDWGPASDIDLVLVVRDTGVPALERAARWDALELPVPADILVYTPAELDAIRGRRFGRVLRDETVWVWNRPGSPGELRSR